MSTTTTADAPYRTKATTPAEIIEAMRPHVMRRLTHYLDDFNKHDRAWIEETEGRIPFLHATRDTGTHLIPLWPAEAEYYPLPGETRKFLFGQADRHHFLRSPFETIEGALADADWLAYGGRHVLVTSTHNAAALARSHVKEVETAWTRPIVEITERILSSGPRHRIVACR